MSDLSPEALAEWREFYTPAAVALPGTPGHSSACRILALLDALAAEKARAEQAEARSAEQYQRWLIDAHPWCVCEEGPYFGAQLVGTPIRCERCGRDETQSAEAALSRVLDAVEVLADNADTQVHRRRLRALVAEHRAETDADNGGGGGQ